MTVDEIKIVLREMDIQIPGQVNPHKNLIKRICETAIATNDELEHCRDLMAEILIDSCGTKDMHSSKMIFDHRQMKSYKTALRYLESKGIIQRDQLLRW